MSGRLAHIVEDFERRLDLRRRMLDHLGIDIPEDAAEALRPEIRTTLLACGRCPRPEICAGWIARRHPGAPMFCTARESFLRLEAATAGGRDARLSA